MIAGGIANIFYGMPRFTRVLDLIVAVESEDDKRKILAVVKKADRYSLLYPDNTIKKDDPELKTAQGLDKVNLVRLKDKQTGTMIDLLLIRAGSDSIYGLGSNRSKELKESRLRM